MRLSIELAATFSWSHMLKYRSLPWDERSFDQVVDGIDWNFECRMKYYDYIVLLEGSILRID